MTSVSTSRDFRVHVVHVIGSLQIGGAEKMLVNFIKTVDKEKFRHTILCLTVVRKPYLRTFGRVLLIA